jgi:hypothetical protein
MSYRRKVWTRSSGCELAASGRAGCRARIVAARALSRRSVRRARSRVPKQEASVSTLASHHD